MVFIDQYIIQIGKDKYHHHSHELAELKRIALSNGRKLDKIIKEVIDTGQPETEGYFSSIEIRDEKFLITSIKGKINLMSVTLTTSQQASGVLKFKDKKLAITDVPDGAVQLTVSDEGIATASYEDATNTVSVKPVAPGVATLSIKATNKAGKDIPFEDIAVEVTSGDAETGSIDFVVTEQPE